MAFTKKVICIIFSILALGCEHNKNSNTKKEFSGIIPVDQHNTTLFLYDDDNKSISKDTSLMDYIRANHKLVSLNEQNDQLKLLLDKLSIEVAPSIVINDEQENEIYRFVGKNSTDYLKNQLIELAEGKYFKKYTDLSISYPVKDISIDSIFPKTRYYHMWKIERSTIDFFEDLDTNSYLSFDGSATLFDVEKNYTIHYKNTLSISKNNKSGEIYDYYLSSRNKIVIRNVIYQDENDLPLKNLLYESKNYNFDYLNKNEMRMYNENQELYLIRDTLRN